jgi:hypothetical protein
MLLPMVILTAIITVITAPGLIAQHIEEKRARKNGEIKQDEHVNA